MLEEDSISMKSADTKIVSPSNVCVGFDLGIQCVGCCWPCWEKLRELLITAPFSKNPRRIQRNRKMFYRTIQFSTEYLTKVLQEGTLEKNLQEIGDSKYLKSLLKNKIELQLWKRLMEQSETGDGADRSVQSSLFIGYVKENEIGCLLHPARWCGEKIKEKVEDLGYDVCNIRGYENGCSKWLCQLTEYVSKNRQFGEFFREYVGKSVGEGMDSFDYSSIILQFIEFERNDEVLDLFNKGEVRDTTGFLNGLSPLKKYEK